MIAYNYVVYSVGETLKQNFANRKIPSKQLLLFTQIAANAIMAQRFSKKETNFYLNVYENIQVKQSLNDNNILNNIPYVDAPNYFFNADLDNGIDFIAYTTTPLDNTLPFKRQPFTRSTLRNIVEMQSSPYELPSPSSPYFVLTNYLPNSTKRIFLFGINYLNVPYVEMGLHSTVQPNVNVSPAATIPIEDHEVQLLIQMVYQAAISSFATLTTRQEQAKDVTSLLPTQAKQAQQAQEQTQQ